MYIQYADIMTDEHTSIITHKPKPVKDPNSLKIASFRTKEGVWADFCSKAEEQGLTATDVLKAAMEQFINGEYQPTDRASVQHRDSVLTRNDVLEIVNTVIGTLSIPTDEGINTLVSTHINTAVKSEIDRALEPISEAIEALKSDIVRSIAPQEHPTGDIDAESIAPQFEDTPRFSTLAESTDTETVGVKIQTVESIAPQEHPTGDTKAESIVPQIEVVEQTHQTDDIQIGKYLKWDEFCNLVGLDVPLSKERNTPAGHRFVAEAKKLGFCGWSYSSSNSSFKKVG